MTKALLSRFCGPGPRFSVVLTLLLLAALPGCKRVQPDDFLQEQAKTEQVMNNLREQGGKVTSKSYPIIGNGYVVDLSGAQLTDNTFQNLKALQRVTELDLSKSSLTDDQMDQIHELAPLLTRLDLSNTAVTDAALEKLSNLEMCSYLNLSGTKVTAAAAQRFEKEHSNPKSFGKIKLPSLKVRR